MRTKSSWLAAGDTSGPDGRRSGKLTWSGLVYLSGLSSGVTATVLSAYLFDFEGAAAALLYASFTWLFSSGWRLAGLTGLIVVSGATAFFMTTAALINLQAHGGAEGVVLALGMSSVSTLTLFGGVGYLMRRDAPSSLGPWLLVAILGFTTLQSFLRGALGRGPDTAVTVL